MLSRNVLSGSLVLAACAASARGEGSATDAVAAMQALLQPIAKMAPGAARTERACAEVDKLQTAAKAIPTTAAGTSVDAATWSSAVRVVSMSTNDLAEACKGAGRKHTDSLGTVHTADEELAALQECLDGAAEDLRPRALTPAMKSFDQPLRRATTDKKRKHVCKDMAEMAKVVDSLEAAPAGADKSKWDKAYGALRDNFGEAKTYCDPTSDDNAVFDGAFRHVHDSFYKMVRALPVEKK